MKRLKFKKNEKDIAERLSWIKDIAKEMNWQETMHCKNSAKLRFKRESQEMIDIYYTSMTIATFTLMTDGTYKNNFKKVEEDEFVEVMSNPEYIMP